MAVQPPPPTISVTRRFSVSGPLAWGAAGRLGVAFVLAGFLWLTVIWALR